MFRLITFCISIVGFAVIVWFGVTVELGERTLFGHLRAIGGSHEAQQLWDGTKGKVTDFVGIEAARRAEAAKEAFKHPPAAPAAPPGTPAPGKALAADTDRGPDRDRLIARGPAVERAPAPARPAAPAHAAAHAPKVTPAHTPAGRRPATVAQKPK